MKKKNLIKKKMMMVRNFSRFSFDVFFSVQFFPIFFLIKTKLFMENWRWGLVEDENMDVKC